MFNANSFIYIATALSERESSNGNFFKTGNFNEKTFNFISFFIDNFLKSYNKNKFLNEICPNEQKNFNPTTS